MAPVSEKGRLSEEDYRKLIESGPLPTVECVVEYRSGVLLVQRKSKPAQGEFWLPGGRLKKIEHNDEETHDVKYHETVMQRLIQSETGLWVPGPELVGRYTHWFKESQFPGIPYQAEVTVYKGIGQGNIKLDSEQAGFAVVRHWSGNESTRPLHPYVQRAIRDSRVLG